MGLRFFPRRVSATAAVVVLVVLVGREKEAEERSPFSRRQMKEGDARGRENERL